MTFAEWQALPPDAAAREVHARVRTHLDDAQRRAVLAWLPEESALTAAFAAAPRGPDHPLGGVPCFVKDLFDLAGAPTRAGSTFLSEVRPPTTADGALVRTMREVGLVPAGKTHLHEFAYGITGENPHYGNVSRPGFADRTSGGSSSGSAAAVAAGVVPIAFGTDTGGSVRVPAAFCGVYGFRAAPGDRWIRDAVPLAPTFDTMGWFTASAAEMTTVLRAFFVSDGRSWAVNAENTVRFRGEYLELPGVDAEVALACRTAAAAFAPPADRTTASDLLNGFKDTLATYNTIVAAEAWDYHRPWAERYREHYDHAVWQRLQRGTALASDAVRRAREHCAAVRLLWTKYFLGNDFLVLPATPTPALRHADCTLEQRNRLLALTAPASVGGLPVLTVPVALPSGLTAGLQIVVNQPASPVLPWILGLAEKESAGVVA